MLESPARYSPGKVKEAVRTFADFLRFLVRLFAAEFFFCDLLLLCGGYERAFD